MFSQLLPALRMLVVLTIADRCRLPAPGHRYCSGRVLAQCERQPDRCRRQDRRVGIDRSAIRRSEVLLEPAIGDLAATVQWCVVVGFESGSAQSRPGGRGERSHQGAARRRSWQRCGGAGRSGHRIGERTRPAHQRRRGKLSGAARGEGSKRAVSAGANADCSEYRRPHLGHTWRAPRQRARTEQSARSNALAARDRSEGPRAQRGDRARRVDARRPTRAAKFRRRY